MAEDIDLYLHAGKNITHTISPDGLTLTSEAHVHGEVIKLTIQWHDVDTAKAHYVIAQQLNEQRFRELHIADNPLTTDRAASARHLATFAGRTISAGRMAGQNYDEAQISLGRIAWQADINPATGRVKKRTWRRKTVDTDDRHLYGIGFRTWAAYITVRPAGS